jgi:hypothetical protein
VSGQTAAAPVRCRHIQRATFCLQPTGCLDFADLFFHRHAKLERFLQPGNFSRSWIDNIDPTGFGERVLSRFGKGA